MSTSKLRYASLDVLKGLACIGVILAHCSFPGLTGKVVLYIAKFNVPIFFMISGYFLYSTDPSRISERLERRVGSIGALLVLAFCINAAWSLAQSCVIGQVDPTTGLRESFPLRQIPHKLIFGTFFCGPMWYLYAAFWGYVSLYIISLRARLDVALWLAVPLLFIHIVARSSIRLFWPDE